MITSLPFAPFYAAGAVERTQTPYSGALTDAAYQRWAHVPLVMGARPGKTAAPNTGIKTSGGKTRRSGANNDDVDGDEIDEVDAAAAEADDDDSAFDREAEYEGALDEAVAETYGGKDGKKGGKKGKGRAAAAEAKDKLAKTRQAVPSANTAVAAALTKAPLVPLYLPLPVTASAQASLNWARRVRPETMAAICDHSNERKVEAKACSNGAITLMFCELVLRRTLQRDAVLKALHVTLGFGAAPATPLPALMHVAVERRIATAAAAAAESATAVVPAVPAAGSLIAAAPVKAASSSSRRRRAGAGAAADKSAAPELITSAMGNKKSAKLGPDAASVEQRGLIAATRHARIFAAEAPAVVAAHSPYEAHLLAVAERAVKPLLKWAGAPLVLALAPLIVEEGIVVELADGAIEVFCPRINLTIGVKVDAIVGAVVGRIVQVSSGGAAPGADEDGQGARRGGKAKAGQRGKVGNKRRGPRAGDAEGNDDVDDDEEEADDNDDDNEDDYAKYEEQYDKDNAEERALAKRNGRLHRGDARGGKGAHGGGGSDVTVAAKRGGKGKGGDDDDELGETVAEVAWSESFAQLANWAWADPTTIISSSSASANTTDKDSVAIDGSDGVTRVFDLSADSVWRNLPTWVDGQWDEGEGAAVLPAGSAAAAAKGSASAAAERAENDGADDEADEEDEDEDEDDDDDESRPATPVKAGKGGKINRQVIRLLSTVRVGVCVMLPEMKPKGVLLPNLVKQKQQ